MRNPILPGDATSTLDEDAQALYLEHFGARYVGVQATPGIPSRRERRRQGDRGHNFGLGNMKVPRRAT